MVNIRDFQNRTRKIYGWLQLRNPSKWEFSWGTKCNNGIQLYAGSLYPVLVDTVACIKWYLFFYILQMDCNDAPRIELHFLINTQCYINVL